MTENINIFLIVDETTLLSLGLSLCILKNEVIQAVGTDPMHIPHPTMPHWSAYRKVAVSLYFFLAFFSFINVIILYLKYTHQGPWQKDKHPPPPLQAASEYPLRYKDHLFS
jgi:hypothetical protein